MSFDCQIKIAQSKVRRLRLGFYLFTTVLERVLESLLMTIHARRFFGGWFFCLRLSLIAFGASSTTP
jgi:hypothetical protein